MKDLPFALIIFIVACAPQDLDNSDVSENCKESVERAKAEFEKGNLYYLSVDYVEARFIHLLEEHLIAFRGINDSLSKIDGMICYKAFMDSVIAIKHGTTFIEKLNQKSDSLNSKIPSFLNTDGSYNFLRSKPKYIRDSLSFEEFKTIRFQLNGAGTVVVLFTIKSDGTTANRSVLISENNLVDSIALKRVADSKWIPGTVIDQSNGKQLKKAVDYRTKISFLVLDIDVKHPKDTLDILHGE